MKKLNSFILLMTIVLSEKISALEFSDFPQTHVLQVKNFLNFSFLEQCEIAQFVHYNNTVMITQMLKNGFVIHPERLNATAKDIFFFCSDKRLGY